jgi:hypothetical protein
MRVNRSILLVAGLITVFLLLSLLPSVAGAKRVTVLGSLAVTRNDGVAPLGVPLTDQVTGLSLMTNPGVEKNIPQQLPPYTIPMFTDKDKETGQGSLDTVVALTNTTSSPLDVFIILRDEDGDLLPGSPVARTIPGHGTIFFVVSALIQTP